MASLLCRNSACKWLNLIAMREISHFPRLTRYYGNSLQQLHLRLTSKGKRSILSIKRMYGCMQGGTVTQYVPVSQSAFRVGGALKTALVLASLAWPVKLPEKSGVWERSSCVIPWHSWGNCMVYTAFTTN